MVGFIINIVVVFVLVLVIEIWGDVIFGFYILFVVFKVLNVIVFNLILKC